MSPHYQLSKKQVEDLESMSAVAFAKRWGLPLGSIYRLRKKYGVKPMLPRSGKRIKLTPKMLRDLIQLRPYVFAKKYKVSVYQAMYLRSREGIGRVKKVYNFPYKKHIKELRTMSTPAFAEKYGLSDSQVYKYCRKLGIRVIKNEKAES